MALSGVAVLVAGQALVLTDDVSLNSAFQFTRQQSDGIIGNLFAQAIIPGVSYVISSSSGLDLSTIAWEILNP